MSKPVKPKFEQVEVKPEVALTEVVHQQESLRIPNSDESTAALFKKELDKFFALLEKRISGKEAETQMNFINTLGDVIKQDYAVYAEVMDYFVSKIATSPKTFAMNNVFRYLALREVQSKFSSESLDNYMAYITATITLAKNLSQRDRVAMMVDIPSLTKGLHPNTVKNIQTYFNRTYN